MRVILVHNAAAGDDHQPTTQDLLRLITAAGHEAIYQPCDDENCTAALATPADLVAVAGGDGTVGRVAKTLVGRHVPFTVLPLGTANNIAKTLGLADLRPEQLVAGWANGRRTKFDIGLVRCPWGRRYFIEGMGVGLFARTMPHAHHSKTMHHLEQADARIAYALQILREQVQCCPAHSVHAVLDGRDLSGEYLLLEAMNMQYVGPNLFFAPDCDLHDGLLDLVLVRPADREKLFGYLSTWQDGKLRAPDLPTYRGRELHLEWSGFQAHVDDELWPYDETARAAASVTIHVSMEHDALEFLVPGG